MFKNYDEPVLEALKPHVEKLVNDTSHDTHETSQRCAAEIIAGLIRGSKHWSYDKVCTVVVLFLVVVAVAAAVVVIVTATAAATDLCELYYFTSSLFISQSSSLTLCFININIMSHAMLTGYLPYSARL